jgi:hypothetical protein
MVRRSAIALCLCVALAGCGGSVSVLEHAAVTDTAAVTTSAPRADHTAVRVVGGTRAQRRAVLEALGVFAGDGAISKVRITTAALDGERGIVVGVHAGRGPSLDSEGRWQAELIAADLVRRIRLTGATLLRLRTPDGFYDKRFWPLPPRRSRVDGAELRERLLQRAANAGYTITSLQTFQLRHTTAVSVVIRFAEEDLFDPAKHNWLGVLFPTSADYASPNHVAVEAPDGTTFYAGSFIPFSHDRARGSFGFGLDFRHNRPDSDPPAFLDGPTNLNVTVRDGSNGSVSEHELDCQPSPRGIPDARRACQRLLRERWAFFIPASNIGCSVPVGSDDVTITGTLGGRAIERQYNACAGQVVEDWELLVDPSA